MRLADLDLEDAAKHAAGNWKDFTCFIWDRDRELVDAEQWAIVYTQNRDSGLLDQSNADFITGELERFSDGDDPDVVFEVHDHWACGWVCGFSVRVFRHAQITEAFRVYHELAQRLADYPILDETDYSDREFSATLENIPLAALGLARDYSLPEGWVEQVYDWLSDNRSGELENVDDQGGWPSEESLTEAFEELGFERKES
jgi:hypothetical protein